MQFIGLDTIDGPTSAIDVFAKVFEFVLLWKIIDSYQLREHQQMVRRIQGSVCISG